MGARWHLLCSWPRHRCELPMKRVLLASTLDPSSWHSAFSASHRDLFSCFLRAFDHTFYPIDDGLRLTDTHNGLRAMTRRGAGTIQLRQNRMAHASEILSQIASGGLRYVEVPVTVEYTAYSLAKGQRLGDSVMVLFDLFAGKLYR